MDDMWKLPGRIKPVPLDHHSIVNGTFMTPPVRATAVASSGSSQANESAKMEQTNGNQNANGSTRLLRDQKELSVMDNLALFIDRCVTVYLLRYQD